jgi:predicted molibdopterin-dependent oxidoreductase YjgC
MMANPGKGGDTSQLVTVEFYDDDNGAMSIVQVLEGTKITEAAVKAGVYIPTLCHHPRLTPVGKCGLCAVSVENGPTPIQLACSTACRSTEAASTMKVHVHGKHLNDMANAALQRNLDVSLVHQTERFANRNEFSPCGTLEIEDLADWMESQTMDESSNCIVYDPSLCVACGRCIRACDSVQGMKVLTSPLPSSKVNSSGLAQAPPCMTTRSGRPLNETDCISCGQVSCVSSFPFLILRTIFSHAVCMCILAESVRCFVQLEH